MISGLGQFAIALQHARGQLRRGLHRGAQRRRGQFAERRQHRIHLQDVELRQQAAQQFAERLAHGVAGAVGLLHQVGDFFAEGQAVQRGAQFVDRRVPPG